MIKVTLIFIVMLAGAAVVFDFRTFRIPNRLNFLGFVTGVIYNLIQYGFGEAGKSILWSVITIVALFVLYVSGVLGAGDIKLYAALSTFVHMKIIYIIAMSFVAAALYGVLLVLKRGGGVLRERTRIHMSLPVFVGVLLCGAGFL
ncbi:MAG: A24 family peptidase [Clostridium sp.]|nr:A24 family peptidase [Clostridium sp.]